MEIVFSIINNRNDTSTISPTFTPNVTASKPTRPRAVDFCELDVDKSAESIAYIVFMVSLLVASVIGNLLVITASILSRQLRKRVTVYFIVSLAISDMVNASVLIPISVSQKLHYNRFCHSLGACYWVIIGDATTTLASILNLVFIAMDRFVAISFPYKHRSLFSASRVRKIIIGIWVFSSIYSFCGIIPWTEYKNIPPDATFAISTAGRFCVNHNRSFYVASFLGVYILPLLLITFTYGMILKIAWTQIHAIESTHIDTPRAGTSRINDEESKKQRLKRIKRKELRATKSVGLVYLFFVICWMPAFIIITILEFDGTFFPTLFVENKTLFLFVWYGLLQILPAINTMINPIIYSFSNKGFRKAFKSVFRKLLLKNESSRRDTCQRTASAISAGSLHSTVIDPNSQSMTRRNKVFHAFNIQKSVTAYADSPCSIIDKKIQKQGQVNKGYIAESSLSDDSCQNENAEIAKT